MNTRSQNREHPEAASPKAADDRGNNQEEHDHDYHETKKARDAIAELAEGVHNISFGEPSDSATATLDKITTCSQLEEAIPAICNEVFSVLGPYNLEATYQRGVTVLSEVTIPILYKGQRIATRRLDLYLKLDRPVILELKAVVTGLKPEHMKQLKFYLQHFKVSDGILINFPHMTGFPDESNVEYVQHVLQPEGGAGVTDRVTRSSTPRKDAAPQIIHVQVKTAKKTVKTSTTKAKH